MKTKKFKSEITASINAWAKAYGTTHSDFCLKLQRAGVTFKPGQPLGAQEVFKAITFRSEKDEAIARKANADAERREMENRTAKKELMNLAQIEKVVWVDCLAPLRVELLNLPAQVASLCNPDDPGTVQKVLDNHIAGILQKIHPVPQPTKPTES